MNKSNDVNAAPVQPIVLPPFAPYYADESVTIYNADCRQVLPFLPKFDLLLTDPPYGDSVVNHAWDKITNYSEFTESWFPIVPLKGTSQALVFCSMGRKSDSLIVLAEHMKRQMMFQDMIVWQKQRGRGNRRGYLFVREEILWATVSNNYVWNVDAQYSTQKYHESWIKRLGKQGNPYKRMTNVFTDIEEVTIEAARTSGSRGNRKTLHPTQKPVSILQRFLKSHTLSGGTVVDPFAGSGTTGVACKLEGRKAVLIEISEEYCEKAADRLRQGVLF